MRRIAKPFALVLICTMLFACGTPTSDASKEVAAEQDQVVVVNTGLVLNNGQRWKVSTHMVVPIRRMQERIAEAQAIPVEKREHAAIVDSLFLDMDQLVAACDMQGKAHDVLHEWLIPHMQLVQDLERAKDPILADSLLYSLARSAAAYDHYFE